MRNALARRFICMHAHFTCAGPPYWKASSHHPAEMRIIEGVNYQLYQKTLPAYSSLSISILICVIAPDILSLNNWL